MPDYCRARLSGGTYFFTVVTYQRRPFLTDPVCRDALRAAIRKTRQNYPFTVDAWVLLPDHLHCIWTLPPDDHDFSKRWGLIKATFTKRVRAHTEDPNVSPSRRRRREATVWQRRFWEHQIRDERDLRRHMDYIHFNPVRHGLVDSVRAWPFSTFHRFVKQGIYSADWGALEEDESNFGEPE